VPVAGDIMRLRKSLRTIVVCALLEGGALLGAPMKVEQLQELLRSLSQPKAAQTEREEDDKGDGGRDHL